MLAPNDRTLYSTLFTPPAGYELDHAVGTTFSLDLRTLLVLPLTLATHRSAELGQLDKDPVAVLESVRSAAARLTVFCQHGRIHLPPKEHPLYALVEPCIVPVRSKQVDGVFHPKTWVLRYVPVDRESSDGVLLRAVVLSRNLTFDRSWDFVLSFEGKPWGRPVRASYGLAELIEAAPGLAVEPVSEPLHDRCAKLGEELRRTRFELPQGFEGEVSFYALGLDGKAWQPRGSGRRALVVSPFVDASPLAHLDELATDRGLVVSRDDELNKLAPEALANWDVRSLADNAHVSADAADDEAEAPVERLAPPDGLHAKLIALEHGRADVTWWMGSANATSAAWQGRNVELVVELSGKQRQVGIDKFLESGFGAVLAEYLRSEPDQDLLLQQQLEHAVEAVRDRLVASKLHLDCTADGEVWTLTLQGQVELDDEIRLKAWPVTLPRHRALEAQPLARGQSLAWPRLSMASLSTIMAFELSMQRQSREVSLGFAMQLPCKGLPENRTAAIVRSLVQSQDGFLRYLRFILAGDDPLAAFELAGTSEGAGEGTGAAAGRPWDLVVLEELLRAASRDPARLLRVERLVQDLTQGSTDQGTTQPSPIPPGFLKAWEAVRAVFHQQLDRQQPGAPS